MTRSLRSDVRNPVLSLPGVADLKAFPPEVRAALATVVDAIGKDARVRAQESWRKNKGPMAAYWKAVGAYSTHIKRNHAPDRSSVNVKAICDAPYRPASAAICSPIIRFGRMTPSARLWKGFAMRKLKSDSACVLVFLALFLGSIIAAAVTSAHFIQHTDKARRHQVMR